MERNFRSIKCKLINIEIGDQRCEASGGPGSDHTAGPATSPSQPQVMITTFMYAQKFSGVYMRLHDPIPHLLSEDDIILHELPGQRHGVADVHVVVPRPVDHLTANQSSVLRPAVDQ